MSGIYKIMIIKLLLIIFLMSATGYTFAQYGSFGLTDARQLALGNTYATNSRGLYAAGKNPALLAYNVTGMKCDILFPNLSLRQYNVIKVSNLINDYFAQNKRDVIAGIDGSTIKNALGNGGKLYLGLQIGFLGVGFSPSEKIGSFSFVMKDFLNSYLHLPNALVEIVNSKNESQRAVYFRDFNFEASWNREYELSYGKSLFINRIEGIRALYAGIGIKYIQGFIYDNMTFSAGSGYSDGTGVLVGNYTASHTSAYSNDINTDNLFNGEQVMSHVPFMDPVGQGMGIDLGIALQSERGIDFGISLTDAGFINWNGKTKKTIVSGAIRIDSTLTIDDIDSLAKVISIEKISDNQFQTHPNTAFHMGLSFQLDKFIKKLPGKMGLALEFHQGLIKDLINPEFPRVAAGLDYKPGKWWPVLLTGISTTLNNQMSWSLGLGYELNFLELYIALPDMLPVIQGKGMNTLSVSACWHFLRQEKKVK
jgi:hypothetical protein